jgi:hypothetical protein
VSSINCVGLINLHNHPESALDFSCDGHGGLQVTMPISAAESALTWDLPVVLILHHITCGKVAHNSSAASLGSLCSLDSDCDSTLICENRKCAEQPDIVFFSVKNSPVILNKSSTGITETVKFTGKPLDRDGIDTLLMNEHFAITSIAPKDKIDTPSQQRKCDVKKWGFVPDGYYCSVSG